MFEVMLQRLAVCRSSFNVSMLQSTWTLKQRYLCTQAKLKRPLSEFSVVKLSSKSIIKLSGSDAYPFLQGLITNDIQCLQHECTSLYTQLLTIKGRVFCDLLLYTDSDNADSVLMEVDSSQKDALMKLLKMYRIRKKVTIEDTPGMASFAAFGCLSEQPNNADSNYTVYRDPRLERLGWRVLTSDSASLDADVINDENVYKMHRYKIGVGEGPLEHLPEKALPLESNLDLLNGVNFNKGCFIGQELTSRSRYTGVIRKRIMPVTLQSQSSISPYTDVRLSSTDKPVGVLRGLVEGHCYGIALLRVNNVLKPSTQIYTTDINGNRVEIKTHRPDWWPDGVGVI